MSHVYGQAAAKAADQQKIANWLIAEEKWKLFQRIDAVFRIQLPNGRPNPQVYVDNGAYSAHLWWARWLGGELRDIEWEIRRGLMSC